jgi:H+/Cl- antiporter ClcA
MERWQLAYLGMRQIPRELNEFERWLCPAVSLGIFAVVVAAAAVAASTQGTISTIVLRMELTARDR